MDDELLFCDNSVLLGATVVITVALHGFCQKSGVGIMCPLSYRRFIHVKVQQGSSSLSFLLLVLHHASSVSVMVYVFTANVRCLSVLVVVDSPSSMILFIVCCDPF